MPPVLVVEDERDIREVLRRYLERAGLSVLTTGTGAEAIRLLTSAPPDLVVLDLGLPDVDGTDVLREIQAAGRPPVLVLTARSTIDDRIHGLQLGADDYVTKPFSPAEVVLRVQAVLHRSGGQPGPGGPVTYGQGRLRIDEPRHEASLDGRSLDLTPTEWDLLAAVAAAPERVFSRYELVNRIRGYEYAGYERTIDSHVKNLRHKLGASGADVLETVLGVGYRLRLRRDDPA
ncbi:MAG: response regulator transcription factor [Phycicoccus sp.]|nr:response regulator transcription factor [Phycicoccus sp.]